MRIKVEIAPGELLDKLSILEIKAERISDPDKLRHIRAERETLAASRSGAIAASPEIDALFAELRAVNSALWDIEDDIRVLERNGDFGTEFVRLARSVYRTNDRRAEIKRDINRILGSDIAEEKSYEEFE
ncbi:MAG: DUF6165 family protein [Rhodospirillaceae bacterium]